MELRCKKCNNELILADVIDTYGGLEEDYYIERQIHSCDKCKIDYVVEKRIDIQESDIEVIYFEEG